MRQQKDQGIVQVKENERILNEINHNVPFSILSIEYI